MEERVESLRRLLSREAGVALSYPAPGAWMPSLPPGVARLSAGYPFAESLPTAELAALTRDLLAEEHDLPLHYLGSPSMGALPGLLRERMARRGMSAAADELLVTSGACQAIDLAARALLSPGDAVAVEAPTYMEALEMFRNYTGEILSYPVDEAGLDTGALAADLARRQRGGLPLPKVLYTIASFQNPTGATLSPERRRHLLALAEEYDFLILEDDAYGELAYDTAPVPLKALDTAGRVVYLGSLSKIVAPGLRIGWAAGPAVLVRAMGTFKKDLDHPLGWALAARFLTVTDMERRVAGLRQAYRHRRDFLLEQMERQMPEGVSWTTPGGGFFVWVTLPPGMDSLDLLPASLKAGVSYVPGRYFYFEPLTRVRPDVPQSGGVGAGGGRATVESGGATAGEGGTAAGEGGTAAGEGGRRLRLSFSYLPAAEMARGVAALARVVRAAL